MISPKFSIYQLIQTDICCLWLIVHLVTLLCPLINQRVKKHLSHRSRRMLGLLNAALVKGLGQLQQNQGSTWHHSLQRPQGLWLFSQTSQEEQAYLYETLPDF